MKRFRIDHVTEYRFHAPTRLLEHRLRMRPREDHGLRIASSTLAISPEPTIRWQRDVLGNSVAIARFRDPATTLHIASTVDIEHYEEAPLDFIVEPRALTHPFSYDDREAPLLQTFQTPSYPNDAATLDRWLALRGMRETPMETFVLLDRMNHAVHEHVRYRAREEEGVQSPAETLSKGSGSCRDLAVLFLEACRTLGLASRFVSGYLHAPDAPGNGATHAWVEVYLPGPGWKGFDPTTSTLTGTDHIAVAVAQNASDVPPVSGSYLGDAEPSPALRVSVRVERAAALGASAPVAR